MNHIKFVVAGALALLGVLVIGGYLADRNARPGQHVRDERQQPLASAARRTVGSYTGRRY